jgi:hypothetical protein
MTATDVTAAQKEFSRLKTCPIERVKITDRDSPPPEIANDPKRLALWRQSRKGVFRFVAEGCGSNLLLNCQVEPIPETPLFRDWYCRSAGQPVSSSRFGSRFPAYAENCTLEFPEGGMSKVQQLAQSDYVQVGALTIIEMGDSLTDAMKEKIRPKACELGGNLVVMTSSTPNVGGPTIDLSQATFIVLRKKD